MLHKSIELLIFTPMIIKDSLFGDNYKIKVEDLQYTVMKKTLGDNWRVLGYFNTLGPAFDKMIKSSIIDNNEEMTIPDYIKTFEAFREELRKRYSY